MVTTIEHPIDANPVESKVKSSAETLTQLPISVPTTGLVFNMAMSSPVYSLRPVLFTGSADCPISSVRLVL